jgi:uncharacterized membrane protein
MYQMKEHNLLNKYRRLTKSVNKLNELINKICAKNFYTPVLGQKVNQLRNLRQQKIQQLIDLQQILCNKNYEQFTPFKEILKQKKEQHLQQVMKFKLMLNAYYMKMENLRARKEMEQRNLENARRNRIRTNILNKIKQDINGNLSYIQTRIVFERETRRKELEKLQFNNMSVCQEINFSHHKCDLDDVVVKDVYHQPVASYRKRPINLTSILLVIFIASGLYKTAIALLLLSIIAVRMMVKENQKIDDYYIEIKDANSKVIHEEPAHKANKGELTMRSKIFYLNY